MRAYSWTYPCACADKEVSPRKVSLSRWKHVASTQQIINNSNSTRILPQNNSSATKITITIHQRLVWQGKSQKLNMLHKGKRNSPGQSFSDPEGSWFSCFELCAKLRVKFKVNQLIIQA